VYKERVSRDNTVGRPVVKKTPLQCTCVCSKLQCICVSEWIECCCAIWSRRVQLRCRLQGMDSLPAPDRQDVQLRRQDGGYYAAIVFNGRADPSEVEAKVQQRPCTSMKTCL